MHHNILQQNGARLGKDFKDFDQILYEKNWTYDPLKPNIWYWSWQGHKATMLCQNYQDFKVIIDHHTKYIQMEKQEKPGWFGCKVCGEQAEKICGQCKVARYCSVEH